MYCSVGALLGRCESEVELLLLLSRSLPILCGNRRLFVSLPEFPRGPCTTPHQKLDLFQPLYFVDGLR